MLKKKFMFRDKLNESLLPYNLAVVRMSTILLEEQRHSDIQKVLRRELFSRNVSECQNDFCHAVQQCFWSLFKATLMIFIKFAVLEYFLLTLFLFLFSLFVLVFFVTCIC